MTECLIVSHTHWDREWYRPFEAFRARLVDTVDLVLDQLAADPGWAFLLDGQTIVIEDYLEVRPHRREEIEAACRAGRLGIGPWYVQPDSLLPTGEAHVRNLLEGRRVGEQFGPVSRVGYTPDSFGHPAQFPQMFAGFGLGPFVYWRGDPDRVPSVWRWVAPDGTAIAACLMAEGYFPAAWLGEDTDAAAERLEALVGKLDDGCGEVLLMNGLDHAPPDARTADVAEALAARTGWTVRRGILDDHVARIVASGHEYAGELLGGRITNLLPGVWSTRTWIKVADRRIDTTLTGWAEPFAVLGAARGLVDEAPSVRQAWRALLANQAHDSIGGCSTDAVHEQMRGRYDTALGLADQTTGRVLERLSGLPNRRASWQGGMDVAVWNPSPHPRTDRVRFAFDGHPAFMIGNAGEEIHSLVFASAFEHGVTVDGESARVVKCTDPGRVRVLPEQAPWDVEFVAADVPAFGWRRYRLAPGPASPDDVDDGRTIEAGGLRVSAADDGTLTLRSGDREWSGLFGVEDTGDRGDTYDYDGVDGPAAVVSAVKTTRRRHPSGLQELELRRTVEVPRALAAGRSERAAATVALDLVTTVHVSPGCDRVDVDIELDNHADDHRLRLLFPTGASEAHASTTFGVATRGPGKQGDDAEWIHPAQTTFCLQGWVEAGGLTVGAPGLRECELLADGTLAITLLRSVGWMSGMDLRSRPIPAGPGMPTPNAQCHGRLRATISLLGDARDAELGLRAVAAGPAPLVAEGDSLLTLEPAALVLSALKPAVDGDGAVLRVLNPTADQLTATVRLGRRPTAVRGCRLDETPADVGAQVDGAVVTFPVPAFALRSVRLSL